MSEQSPGTKKLLDGTDDFFGTVADELTKYKTLDDPLFSTAMKLTGLICECLKIVKILKEEDSPKKEKKEKPEKTKSYVDKLADKAKEKEDAASQN